MHTQILLSADCHRHLKSSFCSRVHVTKKTLFPSEIRLSVRPSIPFLLFGVDEFFSLTASAPAQPQATRVVVFPALLNFAMMLCVWLNKTEMHILSLFDFSTKACQTNTPTMRRTDRWTKGHWDRQSLFEIQIFK